MRIEIWSDVVCPWCYLGKRRLESALAGFEHGDEVEVVHRSFQLDPSAPSEPTETAQQMLARKYGMSVEQAAGAQQQVISLAADEGMTWRHEESPHVGSRDAHRLLQLARAEGSAGQQAELAEGLMDAYFGKARNIADHAVLRGLAVGAGLDAVRVDEVLATDEYADAVEADARQAAAYGAGGVPFFVLADRYGLSGAQPTETFARAVRQAWADADRG